MRDLKPGKVHAHYHEYAVKHVWPLIQHHKQLVEYLPDQEIIQGKYPDREWYWNILFTVIPEWTNKYVKAVNDARNQIKVKPSETKVIAVTPEMQSILDKHQAKSKCKYLILTSCC